MNFFSNHDLDRSNCAYATYHLMKSLKVAINGKDLIEKFELHPYNGSLLSISDVLRLSEIRNRCVKISQHKLTEIRTSFIAELKFTDLSGFYTVRNNDDRTISYLSPKTHAWEKLSLDEFCKCWTNIVLIPEQIPKKQSTTYAGIEIQHLVKTALAYLLLTIFLVAIGFRLLESLRSSVPISSALLFLIPILGSFATAQIMAFELKKDNLLVRMICNFHNKVKCVNVLESKWSAPLGIPLSTIGFSYFFGNVLLITIYGIENLFLLHWLYVLNIATIPVILISIVYQGLVIKKWCGLCILTNLILFTELITTSIVRMENNVVNQTSLNSLSIATFYITIFIAVVSYFRYMRIKNNNETQNRLLKKFKYDKDIFRMLLHRGRIVEDPGELGLKLGNPNSQNKILKVCNPYCAPCAQGHLVLEYLLENSKNVELQIIYNVSSDNDLELKEFVAHLLALSRYSDKIQLKTTLHDWYSNEKKDFHRFSQQYPVSDNMNMFEDEIVAMRNWCKSSDAEDRAPMYFINGYELPDWYDLKDLIFFLD